MPPAKKTTAKKAAPKKAKKAAPKKVAPKMAVPTTQSALLRGLEEFKVAAEKTYGDGKFDLGAKASPYEVISTGSIMLDRALIVGGYVEGRTVEIWGPEGAGKTLLAIKAMVEGQKKYPHKGVYYINVEHRWDQQWGISQGLDPKRLLVATPENAEDVADMVKDACRKGIFSVIVVDSIGAMIPEAEKEKDADQAVMMAQAKIVTRMVKVAASEADYPGRPKVVVIYINQVRANISKFGADTMSAGPFVLRHQTTMKLDVRRTSGGALTIGSDENKQQVGHSVTVRVERNSVALAYRKAEFVLLYVTTTQYGPMGIDTAMEAADLGIETGIIEQNSGWYTNKITGEKVNGKPAVLAMMRENPAMAMEIRTRALDMVSGQIIYTDEIETVHLDEAPDKPETGKLEDPPEEVKVESTDETLAAS